MKGEKSKPAMAKPNTLNAEVSIVKPKPKIEDPKKVSKPDAAAAYDDDDDDDESEEESDDEVCANTGNWSYPLIHNRNNISIRNSLKS